MFNSSQKVEIDGNSICYYRKGKGESIIFVHGITTYSFIWKNIAPHFAEEYDVIVLDLLGNGDSDKPLDKDYSLKAQSLLIYKMCQSLGIKKFHMVCHDVGGGIGQIFAVNYQEMLYDLILINSVAYNFWPVQPIIAMRSPIIRQISMAAIDMGMFEIIVKRGLYHKENLSKELMTKFYKPLKSSLGRKAFLRFAKSLDNKNLTEISKEISELKIPVLIIRGDADLYLSAAIARELHANISSSELHIIKTGGHFIQEDEPEEITKLIRYFINKQK